MVELRYGELVYWERTGAREGAGGVEGGGRAGVQYLLFVPHNDTMQTKQLGDAAPCLIPHTAPCCLHQQVVGAC